MQFDGFWELVLGSLLIIGAITLVANNPLQITEIYMFAFVLVVQSLPFLSGAMLAGSKAAASTISHSGPGCSRNSSTALRRRPADLRRKHR